MAKSLKAIVCPNCGSNTKTETKPDFYVCESCNTEYFLDSEEIIIIHKSENNQPNYSPKPKNSPKPNSSKAIAFFSGVVFFLFLLGFFLSKKDSHSITNNNDIKDDIQSLRDCATTICQSGSGKLYFVTIGIRDLRRYNNPIEEMYVYFTNENGQEEKKIKLDISVPKNKSMISFFNVKEMDNKDQYIIINEKLLLKILPDALEVKDVTNELMNIPEFSSGIAQINEEYIQSGFKILTMDGKSFVYMPLIDKVIKDNEFYDYKKKAHPNPLSKTFFKKETESIIDKPYVLIKYTAKYQEGYPRDEPWFNYKESEGVTQRHKSAHLVKFSRFMSDRLFFNLEVLFNNEDILIVKYNLDPVNENSLIQAIDITSEKVLWTFDCSELNMPYPFFPRKVLYEKDYTLLTENGINFLTLDSKTGKLVNFKRI